MIFDNSLMIADGLAHGGTPAVIDLGTTSPGPGNPIRLYANGVGLAGATGLSVLEDADGNADEDLMTLTYTAAELNDGVEFDLPTTLKRYVTVTLRGTTTAGTWTCGVILP